MPQPVSASEISFGYLSTIYSPEHGYFGGYLIVSALGRPLEFHCTSPVRPSRAQEILYGPTLQPYLVGEKIGGALLAAAALVPQVILTDQPAALEIRARSQVPLAMVVLRTAETVDALHESCERESLGEYVVEFAPGYETDRPLVVESLETLRQSVDLLEPFGRIHEAIREAQRIGGRTPDAHGQAA